METPVLDIPQWMVDALAIGRHQTDSDDDMRQMLKIASELEWRRCESDPFYFLRSYVKIQLHNTAQIVLFPMTPEQEDFIHAMLDETLLLCLKARQIGLSTAVSGVCLWEVFFHPFWHTLFLSRKEDDAKELLAKSKFAYDNLPGWMRERGPARTTNNNSELRFEHSSVIESLPSKDNPARSRSARRVVGDEFSFFDDQVAATASFGPVVDNGAFLTLLSTANGVGDEFHRLIQGARAGNKNGGWPLAKGQRKGVEANNYAFRFYNWRARRDRDDAWYENKRKDMLPHLLAQEFPNDPDEAFRVSGNLYFDPEVIRTWIPSPGTKGFLLEGEFYPAESGDVEVWELPVKGAKYALAIDPAGEKDGDASALKVIRASTGQHVASQTVREEGDLIAKEGHALGKFYNWAFLGVEANGVGKAVLLELKRLRYPRLYLRYEYDRKLKLKTTKLGWYTGANNKEPMLLAMWRVFRDGLVTSCDADFIKQMGEYRRFTDKDGKTTRLGGQPHDDHVMCMGIAIQLIQHLGVDFVDKIEQEDDPILAPGVVDMGPTKDTDRWFHLAERNKEKAWQSATIPRRVTTRTAFHASSGRSPGLAIAVPRSTRTGH